MFIPIFYCYESKTIFDNDCHKNAQSYKNTAEANSILLDKAFVARKLWFFALKTVTFSGGAHYRGVRKSGKTATGLDYKRKTPTHGNNFANQS
jgi:hypothetical protein